MDYILIALGVVALFLVGGYLFMGEAKRLSDNLTNSAVSSANQVIGTASTAPAKAVMATGKAARSAIRNTATETKRAVNSSVAVASDAWNQILGELKTTANVPVDSMKYASDTFQSEVKEYSTAGLKVAQSAAKTVTSTVPALNNSLGTFVSTNYANMQSFLDTNIKSAQGALTEAKQSKVTVPVPIPGVGAVTYDNKTSTADFWGFSFVLPKVI